MYYPNCGCDEGAEGNKKPEMKNISFIRFLNAVPNDPSLSVDIYVNRKPIVKNLKYEDFTEYIPAKSGIHTIQVYPAGNHTEQLLDIRVTLEPDFIYTAAVIGTISDVELELFNDEFQSNKDTAFMRFANISPGSGGFDVSIDNIPVVYDLQYLEATDYLILSEGKHTMKITKNSDGTVVVSHPNMVLKNGNIYTSYIVGLESVNPEIQVLIPLDGSSYIKTGLSK